MREAILKEILHEYDVLRSTEEQALLKREQEVMKKIPEIAHIRKEIIRLMAQKSREIIKNPGKSAESLEHLQKKITALKSRQLLLLSQNGFPPSYLSIRYHCPKCRDTGYIQNPVKEKCSCLQQKLLTRAYRMSDIMDLEKENFDTFDPQVYPDIPWEGSNISQRKYMLELKKRLEEYVAQFPNNKKKTILFTGKTGLGKTFLLNCMAKAILDKDYTVLKISAYKLFDHLFHSTLQGLEESLEVQKRLLQVDVLIIDDLGTETRRNNSTTEDLFNILNERYLNKKHTFLSTNLGTSSQGLNELRERYSDRITSRLFDTSNTMLFKFWGQDVRLRRR